MINLVLRLLVFSLGLDTKPSSIPAVDGFLEPGFHIVVSVVSVVSVRTKKIHRTDITLWKPPVQMLNTKETTNTTCCTR